MTSSLSRTFESNEEGFRPKEFPSFDFLNAVAHDMLQHHPDDDGQLEGELFALGVRCWMRENPMSESDVKFIDRFISYLAQERFKFSGKKYYPEAENIPEEFLNNVRRKVAKSLLYYKEKDLSKIVAPVVQGYCWARDTYKAPDKLRFYSVSLDREVEQRKGNNITVKVYYDLSRFEIHTCP